MHSSRSELEKASLLLAVFPVPTQTLPWALPPQLGRLIPKGANGPLPDTGTFPRHHPPACTQLWNTVIPAILWGQAEVQCGADPLMLGPADLAILAGGSGQAAFPL